MVIREVCPRCQSPKYKKNGHIHNGKQNHQCKDCDRQFVDCYEQYLISDDTRDLIERLLLERLSLRGICRVVGVGLKWLLGFLVTRFEALPDHLNVQPISCDHDVMIQRLEVEADEIASFVQKKACAVAQQRPAARGPRRARRPPTRPTVARGTGGAPKPLLEYLSAPQVHVSRWRLLVDSHLVPGFLLLHREIRTKPSPLIGG